MINIFFEEIEPVQIDFLNKLSSFLENLLSDFGKNEYDLSLVLTNDKYITKLNREYRGIEKPTDVLSFSALEGETGVSCNEAEKELGDIIISVETMKRQADELKVPEEVELTRLAIHGILHLLGFDHEKSEDEEKEMFELQEKYLERFIKTTGEGH